MVNEAINRKLNPWSVTIDDKSIIDQGKFIIVFTLAFAVFVVYFRWLYSNTPVPMNHPEKPAATTAPNKP